MSDLNKKNINYGALNRFYQDLKSHDLSDLNDKIDNIDVPEYSAGANIQINNGVISATDTIYTLPTASNNTLGGVKVGTGLTIDNNGVLSTSTSNLPVASNNTLGCVKVGDGLNINNSILSVNISLIKDAMYTAISKMDRDTTPLNEQYFTIEALDNCKVYWQGNTYYSTTIEYSKDKVAWNTVTLTTDDKVFLTELSTLEKLYIRGNNTKFDVWNSADRVHEQSHLIVENGNFNILGNIMSLIDGSNFINLTGLTEANCFREFFVNSNVFDASDLIIPDVTLANNSQFERMFMNCKKLITTPRLLIMSMNYKSYYSMFSGCTSLTTTPELPATTLAQQCYGLMFKNCTSLVSAPSNMLPATALAGWCYTEMFAACTSLTTPPELPATTLVDGCYDNMFNGCTNLNVAPELPASTLVNVCYNAMFYGCSNLNYIKCLAVDGINQSGSTNNWVSGVASTGTFVKNPNASSWPTGNKGIPSGWTVEDAQ